MADRVAPVLFVNAGAERGGAEVVLLTLLRHLDRARFPPLVCCLRDGPFVNELQRQSGVEVTVVPTGSFRQAGAGLRAIGRLRSLMAARRIALVHANGTGAHIYGGLAAWRAGLPSVYHVHDVPERGWNGQGLVGRLARLVPATVAVTPSRFLAARLARRPVRRARLLSIANGLDPATPIDRPAGTRPLAVWCGRLQRWKGAHVFLQAAAIARRAVPESHFEIVGGTLLGLDPEYPAELAALARSLNLDTAVRFAGHQADVAPFLANADVVVHSSTEPEPFGLVIVEAMLAGKPVIASAAGGPLEIVEPESTGLLVPPGDAAALAAALVRLFRDPALRARMGDAGRDRAHREFSAAVMTRRFEALYGDLLWGGAGAGAGADR